MLSHGNSGGITPTSRRRPSAKRDKTTQPTHIEIIEALRLCLRIASSIISCTSFFVTRCSGLIFVIRWTTELVFLQILKPTLPCYTACRTFAWIYAGFITKVITYQPSKIVWITFFSSARPVVLPVNPGSTTFRTSLCVHCCILRGTFGSRLYLSPVAF